MPPEVASGLAAKPLAAAAQQPRRRSGTLPYFSRGTTAHRQNTTESWYHVQTARPAYVTQWSTWIDVEVRDNNGRLITTTFLIRKLSPPKQSRRTLPNVMDCGARCTESNGRFMVSASLAPHTYTGIALSRKPIRLSAILKIIDARSSE